VVEKNKAFCSLRVYLTRRRGALDSDFKINVSNGWHYWLPTRAEIVFFDELVGMAPHGSCYLQVATAETGIIDHHAKFPLHKARLALLSEYSMPHSLLVKNHPSGHGLVLVYIAAVQSR
jgi:hypothetical protein